MNFENALAAGLSQRNCAERQARELGPQLCIRAIGDKGQPPEERAHEERSRPAAVAAGSSAAATRAKADVVLARALPPARTYAARVLSGLTATFSSLGSRS